MMQGYHDIGGLPGGAMDLAEHEWAPWQKRVEAIKSLIQEAGVSNGEEFRVELESLGADVYDKLQYSERRTLAMANILIKKGVITIDELGRKMREVQARYG